MKRIVLLLTFVAAVTVLALAQLVHGKKAEVSSGFRFSKVVRVELKPTAEQEKILQQALLEGRNDLTITFTPEQARIYKGVFGLDGTRSKVAPMAVPKPGFKVSQSKEEYYETRDFYYVEANEKGIEPAFTTYVDAVLINFSGGRSSSLTDFLEQGLKVELPWNTIQQDAIRAAWAARKEEVTINLTDAQLESLSIASGHRGTGKSRNIKLMYGDLNLLVASASTECKYHTEWTTYCRDGRESCSMLCVPVCDCK